MSDAVKVAVYPPSIAIHGITHDAVYLRNNASIGSLAVVANVSTVNCSSLADGGAVLGGSDDFINFYALQYALILSVGVELLGALFFFATALYLNKFS